MANHQQISSEHEKSARTPRLSGRFVVFSLFGLGIFTTSLMFVYLDLQTRPFRVLRDAIGSEFRRSRPHVEGGRHKGKGPRTLRVSMSVDFPPTEDSPQANKVLDRILALIREHQDLKEFEKVEVNLIQFIPQELAKTGTFKWTSEQVMTGELTNLK